MEITTPLAVVAQTKCIPIADIARGLYKHVGLTSANSVPAAGAPILPPANSGKWSTRNREGWQHPKHDLPKIWKTYSWDTPNFGDSTYGWHTTSRTREVYQVESHEPRAQKIATEILSSRGDGSTDFLVKFSIDALFDKESESFERELFWAVNILQENTGVAGVYASNAARDDYLATLTVDWQFFPPGTADEVVALFRKIRKANGGKTNGVMEQRLKLFAALKPRRYIEGTQKFAAYIGAQFADDLVVFENVHYGNALYVLYDSWRDISKRSRIDLLKGTSESFDRFVHTDGWEERFSVHMRDELSKRK